MPINISQPSGKLFCQSSESPISWKCPLFSMFFKDRKFLNHIFPNFGHPRTKKSCKLDLSMSEQLMELMLISNAPFHIPVFLIIWKGNFLGLEKINPAACGCISLFNVRAETVFHFLALMINNKPMRTAVGRKIRSRPPTYPLSGQEHRWKNSNPHCTAHILHSGNPPEAHVANYSRNSRSSLFSFWP